MAKSIFHHQDDDDDALTVVESTTRPGALFLHADRAGTRHSVRVERAEVLSLIQALTEWAYPAHTPEGPNRSLIEELIAKAVKDQVSAVLPLHLSPQRTATGGGVAWAPEPDAEDGWQRSDPEPGDVGHPRPPASCTCLDGPEVDASGEVLHSSYCMVKVSASATEDGPCAEPGCGHDKGRHRPVCAVVMRDDHAVICRCNAYKAPLPERKTCPHGLGWNLRCRKCETPRPVEPIAFKPPYCGLCKQPWNDGHGQPGDPCPGVEAARQHPGDWHEALWRVRPSAPASEARYCDECGHSWESHPNALTISLFGCTATKGKGRCGCTRRSE